MGIEEREGPRGKRYRYRVYRHGNRHKGPWRETKAEAIADEKQERPSLNLPRNSLQEVAKEYLLDAATKRSKSRYTGIMYNLNKFVLPFFGPERILSTMRTDDVERFVAVHRNRVKNITVWHYVKDIRALMNWAKRKKKYILENPVDGADLDQIRNRREIKLPINKEAIDRGIESTTGPDRLYADTLRYMGLRKNEGNTVRARDVLDHDGKMWLIVRGTKTETSTRALAIPPILYKSYRAAIKKAEPDDYILSRNPKKKIYDRRKLFTRISKAAKIKVVPKDMRDYFTSIMPDPLVASQMLGHRTLDTTAIYTRRIETRMLEAVKNLGAKAWGKNGANWGQKKAKNSQSTKRRKPIST